MSSTFTSTIGPDATTDGKIAQRILCAGPKPDQSPTVPASYRSETAMPHFQGISIVQSTRLTNICELMERYLPSQNLPLLSTSITRVVDPHRSVIRNALRASDVLLSTPPEASIFLAENCSPLLNPKAPGLPR